MEYRPIPGLESRYEINEAGEIRRKTKTNGSEIVKPYTTEDGIPRVIFTVNYRNLVYLVPYLIQITFHPEPVDERDIVAPDFSGEIWRPIVGFEGLYEVSSLGRVKSVGVRQSRFKKTIGSEARTKRPHKGSWYMIANLRREGKTYTRQIHRLVMEAFVGPCPDGKNVNHIDGNKQNNRLDNLEYLTHRENVQHAIGMGLMPKDRSGHRRHAKLSDEDVIEIKSLKGTMTYKCIAERFHVSEEYIGSIISGRARNTPSSHPLLIGTPSDKHD